MASLEPTPLERSEALEQLRVLEHGFSIKMVETSTIRSASIRRKIWSASAAC